MWKHWAECPRLNVPGCLLFIAFEYFAQSHPVVGDRSIPVGKKKKIRIFICTLNNNVWGKREADAHGVHLVARRTS